MHPDGRANGQNQAKVRQIRSALPGFPGEYPATGAFRRLAYALLRYSGNSFVIK